MIKPDINTQYLFQLLRAVLNNEQPPELPENCSAEAVFRLAEHHSVANIAYYGIEKLNSKPNAELMKKWAEVRDREIMRDIIQCTELEQITAAFTSEGIRFITLKGTILKTMYAQSDFRTMCDIDILVDKDNIKKAGKILLSLGYSAGKQEEVNHDVYYKPPVMNIELHRSLFRATTNNFADFFEDIWNKTEPVTGTRYKLIPDYCFAFVMAHAMGHYKWGGTGIRSFMDIYIYRKATENKLNMDRIRSFFEGAGETELFDSFLDLSDMWFNGVELTEKYTKMSEYIIRGGTYGNFENQVAIGMEGKSKSKFLLERFFPNLAYMQDQYPVLRKAPLLLPVFWIVRMIKGATINRKQNMQKFKAFRDN